MCPGEEVGNGKDFHTVRYAKNGNGVACVTLNRPHVLNVYNTQMRDDLSQVLDAVSVDPDVRVVVLNAAGEKAFCAGADLSEFLTAPSPVIARQVRWERDIWGQFLSLRQPLIAALHGFVLGSGIEMSLCCDLRIASEDARFGLPEVSLGIIPAAGGTQTLPRTIGIARSTDMLMTNRWLNAEEALGAGLVNRVVPRAELASTVQTLAERIASFSPDAVAAAKEAVVRGADLALADGLELERRLAMSLLSGDVSPDGIAAGGKTA